MSTSIETMLLLPFLCLFLQILKCAVIRKIMQTPSFFFFWKLHPKRALLSYRFDYPFCSCCIFLREDETGCICSPHRLAGLLAMQLLVREPRRYRSGCRCRGFHDRGLARETPLSVLQQQAPQLPMWALSSGAALVWARIDTGVSLERSLLFALDTYLGTHVHLEIQNAPL